MAKVKLRKRMPNPQKLWEEIVSRFTPAATSVGEYEDQLVLVTVSDVNPTSVEWLWPDRIPLGKLTLLVGNPGVGKSFLTMDIAARVTQGKPWPESQIRPNPKGSVVILSAEDDPADTIRPRLDSAGADPSKVFVVKGVQRQDKKEGMDLLSLKRDVRLLEGMLRNKPDIRLVIIDPISAYMGETDSHKNAEVRGVLAPLADMASEFGVCVLGVSHLNKDASGQPIYRTMGSLAFTAAPRAVHVVVKEPESERRLLLPVKMNLAKMPDGIAYTVKDMKLIWDKAPVTVSADEVLGNSSTGDQGPSAIEEAMDWLEAFLENGPKHATDVISESRRAGLSKATIRRAKEQMGIKPKKAGFGQQGGWMWGLPDDTGEAAQSQS